MKKKGMMMTTTLTRMTTKALAPYNTRFNPGKKKNSVHGNFNTTHSNIKSNSNSNGNGNDNMILAW